MEALALISAWELVHPLLFPLIPDVCHSGMRKQSLILVVVLLAPAALVGVFKPTRPLGLWMLLAGFGLLILTGLVSTFRHNKLGPFALWTGPAKYPATKFTATEVWMFKLSARAASGGLLAMGVRSLEREKLEEPLRGPLTKPEGVFAL